MERQIKSKGRVTSFGEVYTARKQVVDMVGLVADDIQQIETTVLEPACGNGNFLVEILSRKLHEVRSKGSDSEQLVLTALASVYGVDIQNDNVVECRERLYQQVCQSGMLWSDEAKSMAQKILQKNIICGNTLTMLDGAGKPMRIPEWEIKDNGSAVRKDVLFSDMVACGGSCENYVSRQKYNWMSKMVVQSA